MKNKKKIKILAILLVLIEIICVNMTYKSYNNKIKEQKTDNTINNMFSIRILQSTPNGSEWVDYDKNTWPGSDYKLNLDKTQCYDRVLSMVDVKNVFKYEGNQVKVVANKSLRCFLYFDLVDMPPVIKDIVEKNNDGSTLEVKVDATDDKGIKQWCYSYKLKGTDSFNEPVCTSSDTHKFEGLTAKKTYTVKVTVSDKVNPPVEKQKDFTMNNKRCGLYADYISDVKQYDLYRYYGQKTQVTNNYICIGTYDKSECIKNPKKYLYRILGVDDDCNMKVMLNTTVNVYKDYLLEPSSSPNFKWETKPSFNELNGQKILISAPSQDHPQAVYSEPKFINSDTYDYLKENSEWYNKIMTYTWKFNIGGYKYPEGYIFASSGDGFGTGAVNISAKVVLPYIVDYVYSISKNGYNCEGSYYGGRLTENTSTTCKNSWLSDYDLKFMDIAGFSYGGSDIGALSSAWASSKGTYYSLNDNHFLGGDVYPVFYLSNSKIDGSSLGTKTDPYMIVK